MRLKNWFKLKFKRYLPIEITGTVAALAVAWAVSFFTDNLALLAIAGTWGENLGFYGFFGAKEVWRHKSQATNNNLLVFWKTVRNTVMEFGPSEILDSFLIRPLAMYFGAVLVGNIFLGLFIGKIFADMFFYFIAAFMHDVKEKYLLD